MGRSPQNAKKFGSCGRDSKVISSDQDVSGQYPRVLAMDDGACAARRLAEALKALVLARDAVGRADASLLQIPESTFPPRAALVGASAE